MAEDEGHVEHQGNGVLASTALDREKDSAASDASTVDTDSNMDTRNSVAGPAEPDATALRVRRSSFRLETCPSL